MSKQKLPTFPLETVGIMEGFVSLSTTLPYDKGHTCYMPPFITFEKQEPSDQAVEVTITIKRKDRREG